MQINIKNCPAVLEVFAKTLIENPGEFIKLVEPLVPHRKQLEQIALSTSSQDQNPFFRNINVHPESFTRPDGGITNRYYVNLKLREKRVEN